MQTINGRPASAYTVVFGRGGESAAKKLADAIEKEWSVQLKVQPLEVFSGENGIFIAAREYDNCAGHRYALSIEETGIYLDAGTDNLFDAAIPALIRVLDSKTAPYKTFGYWWPENCINYELKFAAQRGRDLCSGVHYYHRSYIRNDGLPVEMDAIIVDPNSLAKAVCWGCPQGESMIVPGQVEQMRQKGKDVIAAVNADFFHFFNDGDKTTTGMQIFDGVVYKEPAIPVERYGDHWFGLTYDGKYEIGGYDDYYNVYKGNLYQAVGGGDILMIDNVVQIPQSRSVDPRTAVGITVDGGLVILCVDGRTPATVGATMTDMVQLFFDLGVSYYRILNLDGGGSTVMVGKGTDGEMEILNMPCYGVDNQRPVADILALAIPGNN